MEYNKNTRRSPFIGLCNDAIEAAAVRVLDMYYSGLIEDVSIDDDCLSVKVNKRLFDTLYGDRYIAESTSSGKYEYHFFDIQCQGYPIPIRMKSTDWYPRIVKEEPQKEPEEVKPEATVDEEANG